MYILSKTLPNICSFLGFMGIRGKIIIQIFMRRSDSYVEHQFEIVSAYSPQGDQPVAIEKLVEELIVERKSKCYLEQQERVRHLRFQMSLKKCKSQRLSWLTIKR